MARFVLEGPDMASVSVTVFADALGKYDQLLTHDAILVVSGDVEATDRETRILIGRRGFIQPFGADGESANGGPEPPSAEAIREDRGSSAVPVETRGESPAEAARVRNGSVVTVTLDCSESFDRSRALLGRLSELAKANAGAAELRLVVRGAAGPARLRWPESVEPSGPFVRDLESEFGEGTVQVSASPEG